MKKDKKIKNLRLWFQWRQSPQSFANILVYISFFVLFIPPFIVSWKLYKNEHLFSIQTAPLQSTEICPLYIQHMLLTEVVSGKIPPQNLKLFLQKTPEPWAQNLLTQLTPIIDDIKTYPQLEELFVLLIPPERSPVWERIKTLFISPSLMSRIREEGQYQAEWMGAIQQSLRNHNIQNALYYFAKLPRQKQSKLALWKNDAKRLFVFENIMKNDATSKNKEKKTLQSEKKFIAFERLKDVMDEGGLYKNEPIQTAPLQSTEICPLYIQYILLTEVVSGRTSPKNLKLFLQKTPEPWAQNLLTQLTPIIDDIKTYPQLEEFFVLLISPKRSPVWERIKTLFISPSLMSRIREERQYQAEWMGAIQQSLHNHNIRNALYYFAKLPRQKQSKLALWKNDANRLFVFESIMKNDATSKNKEKKDYKKIEIQDIQEALRNHDIQKVLKYYEDLDPRNKNILKNWSENVKRLQILESEVKRLYLKITEELN